ncbi:helix-turn-helix domain-containing protein [Salipaludibacillus sp. CF4.18]|uniref:helix-turn-helix domain-containing protein n=1 Tax=Salipaludibacillus sp. CF4.18 TaxID=3373081 RepID=UPI003EE5E117
MSFGSNVRYYRVKSGYTLKDLSNELQVSVNYLSTLEQNNAKIKPEFLPALCTALSITLSDLYEENADNVFNE